MKGLALEMMAYFVIALIGVIVLFMFVTGRLSTAMRNAYCKLLAGISGLLPIPRHLKPSLPSYCVPERVVMEECVIRSRDPNAIAFQLASHVIACWKKTGEINVGQDKLCYECYVEYGVNGVVTKDMVVSYLLEYSSKYGSIMDWKIDGIAEKTSVGIKYNAVTKLVEVI